MTDRNEEFVSLLSSCVSLTARHSEFLSESLGAPCSKKANEVDETLGDIIRLAKAYEAVKSIAQDKDSNGRIVPIIEIYVKLTISDDRSVTIPFTIRL